MDNKAPYIAVVRALKHAGFVRKMTSLTHKPGCLKEYDAGSPSRSYLLCVLAQDELFTAGAVPFDSCQIDLFYFALLRLPATVTPGGTAKSYRALLNKCEDVDPLRVALINSKAAPTPPAVPGRRRDAFAFDYHHGERPVDGGPHASEPAHSHSTTTSSSSSSSTADSDTSDVAGSTSSAGEGDPFPKMLFGVLLERKHRVRNGVRYFGLQVRCSNPRHHTAKACTRYRALEIDTWRWGQQAPLIF